MFEYLATRRRTQCLPLAALTARSKTLWQWVICRRNIGTSTFKLPPVNIRRPNPLMVPSPSLFQNPKADVTLPTPPCAQQAYCRSIEKQESPERGNVALRSGLYKVTFWVPREAFILALQNGKSLLYCRFNRKLNIVPRAFALGCSPLRHWGLGGYVPHSEMNHLNSARTTGHNPPHLCYCAKKVNTYIVAFVSCLLGGKKGTTSGNKQFNSLSLVNNGCWNTKLFICFESRCK